MPNEMNSAPQPGAVTGDGQSRGEHDDSQQDIRGAHPLRDVGTLFGELGRIGS